MLVVAGGGALVATFNSLHRAAFTITETDFDAGGIHLVYSAVEWLSLSVAAFIVAALLLALRAYLKRRADTDAEGGKAARGLDERTTAQ